MQHYSFHVCYADSTQEQMSSSYGVHMLRNGHANIEAFDNAPRSEHNHDM